jgi:hypothetical protein
VPADAFVLDAKLVGWSGVSRTLAIRGDQTLDDLHLVLQDAFEWENDHLYAFWLSGRIWDGGESAYMAPFELDPAEKSTEERIDRLGLELGQRIAYVFDFGDEWHVELRVEAIAPAEPGEYPRILASRGDPPPQYVYEDELGNR